MVDMAVSENMALDLVLRALMDSREFCETKEKNWGVLAALIPQTSAQQCYSRWKEIQDMPHTLLGVKSPAHYSTKKLSKLVKSVLHTSSTNPVMSDSMNSDIAVSEVNSETSRNENLGDQLQESFKAAENATHFENKEHIPQRVPSRLVPRSAQSNTSSGSGGQGPNMVIHVCDESKNLKQDFQCPRDLLIHEMRYFAEYLSVDAQRWEEVDISVHCDVQIFDWLMRYVKRSLVNKGKPEERKPKLEPSNVISILISSDFLKMDALVTESVEYCHRNMSAIVATPCNMNCINDKLVTRIAQLFTHNELSEIKDRKDKFKSKLFCKKIEQLFEEKFTSPSSPENAATLFRCSACRRLLTSTSQCILGCVVNRLNHRMTIDKRGHVSYSHIRDPSWDVNDFLQGLREKVKSWKEVYWRLWGSVNLLWCHRCEEYFPLSELGHCKYHPMPLDFGTAGIVGVFPCCQQRVLRFDAMGQRTGCKVRDHRVTKEVVPSSVEETSKVPDTVLPHAATDNAERKGETTGSVGDTSGDLDTTGQLAAPPADVCQSGDKKANRYMNNTVVVKDLLAHRNSVCVPYQRLASARWTEVDVFGVEETALGLQLMANSEQIKPQVSETIDPSEKKQEALSHLPPLIRRSRSRGMVQRAAARDGRGRNRMPLRDEEYGLDEDEDEGESEDTENEGRTVPSRDRPVRQRKVTSASRRDFSTFKSYKWDPQRSARWNQDAQREEDLKRMNELIVYLTKQRVQPPHEKLDRQKQKEFVGGIFSKLEYQFRVSQQAQAPMKTQSSSSQALISQRNRRMMTKS